MKTKSEKERKTGTKGAMNKYPSIIALNVNGLNAPIKRHRDKETLPAHMLPTKDLPQNK